MIYGRKGSDDLYSSKDYLRVYSNGHIISHIYIIDSHGHIVSTSAHNIIFIFTLSHYFTFSHFHMLYMIFNYIVQNNHQ